MKYTAALLLTVLLGTGCASSGRPPAAATVDSAVKSAPGAREGTNLRGVRYCEILVVRGVLNNIRAEVFNTIGLNDCPAETWKAIDPEALKKELDAQGILMNGPRYFLMDRNALASSGGVSTLGGIEMRSLAEVKLPVGSLLASGRRKPYTETTVMRSTEYEFSSGQTVYELVNPEGQVYIMQSYAQIVDERLDEGALEKLGDRLKLPEGWQYRVRKLEQPFVVRTVGGQAHVIQDELENSYQRVDG